MRATNKQRYLKYLGDILENLEFLIEYKDYSINNINKKDQLAIERAFEIIGEASKRLSLSSFYEKYPNVEWSDMARTRDFIIHHYDDTRVQFLLTIINKNIEKNLLIIKNILEVENDDD